MEWERGREGEKVKALHEGEYHTAFEKSVYQLGVRVRTEFKMG